MNKMDRTVDFSQAFAEFGVDSKSDSTSVNAEKTAVGRGVSELLKKNQVVDKLTRIQKLILACDAASLSQDGDRALELQLRQRSREKLAASLGCRVDDIAELVEAYGEDAWESLIVEERVNKGIDSSVFRDASWDRLESAALRKLLLIVEADKVSGVTELLAIGRAANQATRRGRMPGGMTPPREPGDINIGINFGPGDPENGILPSGNLGTIQLRLSHRVHRQIDGTAVREEMIQDGTVATEELESSLARGRVLDNIEMLDLDSIQEAGEKFDKEEGI